MNTPPRAWRANGKLPCRVPGCPEPRQVFLSQTRTRCQAHESERVAALKRRLVLDPVTGETVTANALATRSFTRRQAERSAAAL